MVIESRSMEFKESWKDANLKTICAFSNSSGGILKVVGERKARKYVLSYLPL